MVTDMAPSEATTVREPAPTSRRHRLVSFALLIVCGGTFGLIFSANNIAVTGGHSLLRQYLLADPQRVRRLVAVFRLAPAGARA